MFFSQEYNYLVYIEYVTMLAKSGVFLSKRLIYFDWLNKNQNRTKCRLRVCWNACWNAFYWHVEISWFFYYKHDIIITA